MIYNQIGNNTAGIQYQDDPLAQTIKPDYNKLSMSAWGIPQLDDIAQFAPKMDENLDTTPNEFGEYVKGLQDVTSTAQKFRKLGIDITTPSMTPEDNAAHTEWLNQYNGVVKLGKELQQSRKIREAIQQAGTKDVYTNPVPVTEILKSTDPYIERPDLAGIKAFVDSRKGSRDLAYRQQDFKTAVEEIDNGLAAIDQWEAQAIARKPEFAQQYKADADLQRSALKMPFYDQYKHDNLAYKYDALKSMDAYHKGILDLARQKFGWQQNQSNPIEFDTESLIRKAGEGDVQAIDLINRYYGTNSKGESNGASLTVVKGSNVKKGFDVKSGKKDVRVFAGALTQPDGTTISIKDDANYFVRVDENGKKHVTPVNDISIRSYTQGVIGKVTEAGTSKNKTSNLWSEDETEITDTPISAKKVSNNSGTNNIVIKNKTDFRSKYKY